MTTTIADHAGQASGRAARRRDRRKAQIIGVALQILSTSGYQGMNLEEVAERADIAKPTLYHYFPGKDALVAAALETLTEGVLTRLGTALDDAADRRAGEQLRILIREQLHILTVLYPEVGKVFSYPASWPEEHNEAIKAMRRRHDQIFRDVVERGVAAGEFDCPDDSVALHCLHGVLNHASIWLRPDAEQATQDALVEECLRLFTRR